MASPAGWTPPNSMGADPFSTHFYGRVLTTKADTRAPSLWSNPVITYRFDSSMNATEQAFMELAMLQWEDVANIDFVRVAVGAPAHLTIGDAPLGENISGQTNGIGPNATSLLMNRTDYEGILSIQLLSSNTDTQYAFKTAIHELGHVLGFNHPGPYNASSTTTPEVTTAKYRHDSTGYTLMSYWDIDSIYTPPDPADPGNVIIVIPDYWTDLDANPNTESFQHEIDSLTPMMVDLLTAQYYYGANQNTRTGNDTYFSNSTIANLVFDSELMAEPPPPALPWIGPDQQFSGSVWDAGGYDVFDLSGSEEEQEVDLSDPHPSGARLLLPDLGRFASILGGLNNLFIPYNVVIEKLIGGSRRDKFIARDGVDTTLLGGGGTDDLIGGSGNDTIDGGEDAATDFLFGGSGADTFHARAGDRIYDISGPSNVTINDWAVAPTWTTEIDLGGSNDTVQNFGQFGMKLDVKAGADTVLGSGGDDLVTAQLSGLSSATIGDDIALGAGDDGLTIAVATTYGSGNTYDGGGGHDRVRFSRLEIVLNNLQTGQTSLGSLDDKVDVLNFEEIDADVYGLIVDYHELTISGDSLQTGILNDRIQAGSTSPYRAFDSGSGGDLVVLTTDSSSHQWSNQTRTVALGTDDDVLQAGFVTTGAQAFDGGSGFDVLDFSVLSPAWPTFLTSAWLDVDASLNEFAFEISGSDSQGTQINNLGGGTFAGFEEYRLLKSGLNMNRFLNVTFNADFAVSTRVFVSSDAPEVFVSLGSMNDSVVYDGLWFDTGSVRNIGFYGASGTDTLDVRLSRGLIYERYGFFDLYWEDSYERIRIDVEEGIIERAFSNGYSDSDTGDGPDVVYTARFFDFEVYRLPNLRPLNPSWSSEPLNLYSSFVGSSAAETVFGSDGADDIVGRGGDDTVTGGGGNDTIDGGAGADSMSGAGQDDVYIVDSSMDKVVEVANDGIDTVVSSTTVTLNSHVENLELQGAASIHGIGNSLANRVTGNSGNNILNGASGADTLVGRLGNDLYVVDNGGDVVSEAGGGGIDTVQSQLAINLTTLGNAFENATLVGAGNFNVTGNFVANRLTGNAGNNILNGNAGNDTMAGGAGNDHYMVDTAGDLLSESPGAGIDTIQCAVTRGLGAEFENMILVGTASINAIGNGSANRLTGNAGNNMLNGGAGIDTMLGGAGNDTYVVDHASDATSEAGGNGTDLVISAVSRSLGAGFENLTLSGSAALGFGNELGNVLVGSAGSNMLFGLLGNDIMNGNGGADRFIFSTALSATSNVDIVQAFSPVDDLIGLDDIIFTAIGPTLVADAFVKATAAQDAEDRILYNQVNGALFYDRDGTGTAFGAIQFATLTGAPNISHLDFQIV